MFDSMVDESESMDQCSKTFAPPKGDATPQPGFDRIRNGHRGEEGVIASDLLSITPRLRS